MTTALSRQQKWLLIWVQHCEASRIVFYLQTNRLASHYFMERRGRQEIDSRIGDRRLHDSRRTQYPEARVWPCPMVARRGRHRESTRTPTHAVCCVVGEKPGQEASTFWNKQQMLHQQQESQCPSPGVCSVVSVSDLTACMTKYMCFAVWHTEQQRRGCSRPWQTIPPNSMVTNFKNSL